MTQYIDKSALVAEIKETFLFHKERGNSHDASICDVLYGLLNRIDSIEVKEVGVDLGDPKGDKSAKYIIDTNTLEVKELNLEKEVKNILDKYFYFPDEVIEIPKLVDITAKHFFELGLFSTLTWQDIRLIAEIGNDFMNSEESDNIELTDEAYYGAILDKVREKGRDAKTSWSENRKAKGE